RLDKFTYVGTFTILFAASNIIKIPAYGALGQLTAENLLIGTVLLPVAVIANYAGLWLVRRTPAEPFFLIVYVVMFFISLELIRGGFVGFLGGGPLSSSLLGMPIPAVPFFFRPALPAITALGLGKGGFAGVGMISTPLLALTVPPLQAAAILLPILLCQDVISVWVYRRQWSAWNLKVLLPGAVVGVGAAWLFAAYVPNAYVEIAVGVTGVCFALYNWFAKVPAQPQRPTVMVGMFWGSLAGFTSTIIQVGAPPYQVHILPQRLDKLTLIGTTIIFFALVNVM